MSYLKVESQWSKVEKTHFYGLFFVELLWRLSTAAGTAGGGLFYFCYNQR
jgi:hypothetical protein